MGRPEPMRAAAPAPELGSASRPRAVRPWILRLADAAPLSPPWLGLAVALAVIAAIGAGQWLGQRYLGARPAPVLLWQIWGMFALGTGYGVAVTPLFLRGAERDLDALRPRLACSDGEYRELRASLSQCDRRALIAAYLVGVVGVNGAFHEVGWQVPFSSRPLFEVVLQWAASLPIWMALVPGTFLVVHCALRFRRAVAPRVEVRLFALERLAPFARVGLRAALALGGITGIAVFLHIDWARGGGLPVANGWLGAALFLPIACAAVLLPVWGLRARIRDAKRAELARVEAALAGDRGALADSLLCDEADAIRASELVAYRERVLGLRELPIDTPALLRFALYLSIPLGGWLGGALMERLLDLALD